MSGTYPTTFPADSLGHKTLRRLHGGGACLRCGIPWRMAESHTTYYRFTDGDTPKEGCLPLCVSCWSALTPETRLPFYEQLICDVWQARETDWDEVSAAVLAEPSSVPLSAQETQARD